MQNLLIHTKSTFSADNTTLASKPNLILLPGHHHQEASVTVLVDVFPRLEYALAVEFHIRHNVSRTATDISIAYMHAEQSQ